MQRHTELHSHREGAVAYAESAAMVQFAAEYYPSTKRYGNFHNTHAAAPAYAKGG